LRRDILHYLSSIESQTLTRLTLHVFRNHELYSRLFFKKQQQKKTLYVCAVKKEENNNTPKKKKISKSDLQVY
jgi:hypothetical protein